METIDNCPVCQNDSFAPFLSCEDYLVSHENFVIQACRQCGFRLTNPRPSADKIGSYYKSEQYVSHNDQSSGLINTTYRLARSFTLRSKVNLVNKINEGVGRILDVGCGTGAFLESCRIADWQIVGVEPDPEAATVAKERLGIDIRSTVNELAVDTSFNIITLWHVLEHIPNLNETIQRLRQLLAEKGTLVIAVPNSDSFDAQYFKQHWAAYDVPRHLYHFSPASMTELICTHGCRVDSVHPMWFDSFYVSLLSEKYKTGSSRLLHGFWTGLRSNIKAMSNKRRASSVIYVISV